MVYKFERLSAAEAAQSYPSLWATAREALPQLTDAGIAVVVSLVADTCSHCHESSRRCQCWNDE